MSLHALSYDQLPDEPFPVVDMPKYTPLGGRIMLQLEAVERKTKGGIILTEQTKEDSEYLMHTAKIIAVGDLAFHYKDSGEPWKGAWPTVGDIVRIPIHGGDRWKEKTPFGDIVFVLFDDAHVSAKVEFV